MKKRLKSIVLLAGLVPPGMVYIGLLLLVFLVDLSAFLFQCVSLGLAKLAGVCDRAGNDTELALRKLLNLP